MFTFFAWTTAPALLHAVTPLVSWMAWRNRCISLRFAPESGFVRSAGVVGSAVLFVLKSYAWPLRFPRSYEMRSLLAM